MDTGIWLIVGACWLGLALVVFAPPGWFPWEEECDE
jgi:hypothetical protein